ncbi:MAG: GAF domain-containing protein, partial [Gammaproteobacteria bacterium]|nr:GAF domain-containing protein [Gammaproteobacteria bacterium]
RLLETWTGVDMAASVYAWLRSGFRNLRIRLLGGTFEAITDSLTAVAANNDLDHALSGICETTARAVDCDRVSIFLSAEGRFRARYNFGNPADVAAMFADHSVALDDRLIMAAQRNGGSVVVNDVSRSTLVDARLARTARIRAIAVALLRARSDGEVIGFITMEFNERHGRISPLFSRILVWGCPHRRDRGGQRPHRAGSG